MSEPLKEGDLITVWARGNRASIGNFTPGVVESPQLTTLRRAFTWRIVGGSVSVQGLYSHEGIAWIRGHGAEAEQALEASRRLQLPPLTPTQKGLVATVRSKRTRR